MRTPPRQPTERWQERVASALLDDPSASSSSSPPLRSEEEQRALRFGSQQAIDALGAVLRYDPGARPSAAELLRCAAFLGE